MITEQQAGGAVVAMRICRYFPSEDFQRAQIAAELIEMVNNKSELDWLVRMQVKFGEWKGLGELRGLFCARYNPRDKITGLSTTPGFRASDMEMEYIERQSVETNRMLAEAKREMKLLGESPQVPDVSATVKPITIKPTSREDKALGRLDAENRLRNVVGATAKSICIPGTRKRSDAENADLERELAEELGRRRATA